MAAVGYARVSDREGRQVLDCQVDALRTADYERVYDDRGTGANAELWIWPSTDRPGLKMCLDYLRCGDVLVVLDFDRLERRAGELIRLLDEPEGRSVGFRALNAAFDTTTPAGRVFLHFQGRLGGDGAQPHPPAHWRGHRGRPRAMTPEKLRYARHLMEDRSHSVPAICRELGDLPASTLYHYLHADVSLKALGGAERPRINALG